VGHDLLNFLSDKEVLSPIEGYLPIPEKPGLGIAIDEDAVREAHKDRHRWRNPVWRQRMEASPNGSRRSGSQMAVAALAPRLAQRWRGSAFTTRRRRRR
jgi:hypothetical protein